MPKRPASFVTAEYSRHGYEIFLNHEPIYAACNNPQESIAVFPVAYHPLPLRTMRRLCLRTAKDLAAEHRAQFAGVECLRGS